MKNVNWHLILMIVAIPVGIFSLYLFYFADCNEVKDHWYLTHTPGRCIN